MKVAKEKDRPCDGKVEQEEEDYVSEEESSETDERLWGGGLYIPAETMPVAQWDGLISTKCDGVPQREDAVFLGDTSANESVTTEGSAGSGDVINAEWEERLVLREATRQMIGQKMRWNGRPL